MLVTDKNDSEGGVRAKKKRPDGTDLNRYRNLERWSYQRWAWEFLRRNEEYITECCRVINGTDEEREVVAKRFKLKKFKHYSEPYRGKSGSPKFSIGSISSWTAMEKNDKESHLIKIEKCFGAVIIRFDLLSAINDKRSLRKQLLLAENRLNARFDSLQKLLNKKAALHKPKVETFGRYIRILDYLAAGNTPIECAKLVYPEEGKKFELGELESFELNNLIKNSIKSAKKYAADDYIYLSLIQNQPKITEVPLEAIVAGR